MKHIKNLFIALVLLTTVVGPAFYQTAEAADLAGETFTGISTTANSWISGGSGGSVACLTAASTSAANSIPACSGSPAHSVGDGALRLTPAANTRTGFAIYNTPVSATDGLNITFDMYQYGGSNADGISFFLIDGNANPIQPGAAGGSLGYASADNGEVAGIDGGYIGVGFDRFGNFSNSNVGNGGPGASANNIGIRGSEASGYSYITGKSSTASLSGTTRTNAKRSVKININTNNYMSVAVNYGSGYVVEHAAIDLNEINGEGALPETFKFGFAASTGGSTNIHEIRGLSVAPNPVGLGVIMEHTGTFAQGGTGQFKVMIDNDTSAQPTHGLITSTTTFPAGLTPTNVTANTWTCGISGQVVTCTRPGDGFNYINPGTIAPRIFVDVAVANDATGSKTVSSTVDTLDNASAIATNTDSVTISNGSYLDNDGVFNTTESASPNSGDGNNDGTADSQQSKVTSLPNTVTGTYAVLQSDGCATTNSNVSVVSESNNTAGDGNYTYPVGLMDFSIACSTPGGTATITQYYYGTYDAGNMVVRKYDSVAKTYATISGATISNVTLGGQQALKVVYDITDGSSLDEDGLANGTIVDPAGPAIMTAAVSAPTTAGAASTTTPGTPNTGFSSTAMTGYYVAGFAGLLLFASAIVTTRRQWLKARVTATN